MITLRTYSREMPHEELDYYLNRANETYPHMNGSVDIILDGEYVELTYDFEPVPFQRIRRITGYLVGTLDRFNNAKRAEVEDRVKHSIER